LVDSLQSPSTSYPAHFVDVRYLRVALVVVMALYANG
jgi:hypothetical protein